MNGKGVTQGEVHAVFQAVAADLQADAVNVGEATVGSTQLQWQVAPVQGWSGDPLDIAGTSKKFSRTAIHENYTACLSDASKPGTVADTQALTLQNDWLCMQERAFRARHSSFVRSAIHAAGRRAAHGHPRGVIAAGVVKYIEDLIKQGA